MDTVNYQWSYHVYDPVNRPGLITLGPTIVLYEGSTNYPMLKMAPPRNLRYWVCLFILAIQYFFMSLIFNQRGIMNILPTRTNPLGHSFPQSIYRRLLQEQSERKNHSGNLLQRNPNCIIIGVRKCGTRALLEFLSIHPNIQISKSEMHFFNKEHNYKKGLEWYRKEMPYTYEDEITIEKTPAYFITKKVPERIYKMNQTIKLLIIFRDPTVRVVSDYTQVCHNRMAENKTCFQFKDLVMNPMISKVDTDYRAVDTSIYCKHLLRWMRLFPIEQMHFVDGDILLHNPLHELRKVETFLNLEHKFTADNFYFNSTRGFYCMRNTTTERCLSSGKGRKHAKVDPYILDNLRTFFEPYNKRLFKMIGRKFTWPCCINKTAITNTYKNNDSSNE